jgi:hypothetical protein
LNKSWTNIIIKIYIKNNKEVDIQYLLNLQTWITLLKFIFIFIFPRV